MQFFYDKPRKLLIYDRPSELVLQHIPEAKRLNGQYVAIPQTLRNSQVLRWLNYPVPPIVTEDNYDWPIQPGREAKWQQKIMTNFQLLHPRCFNLSDPGTMKTLASLWAADKLMQAFPGYRALIVAPLNVLETVWAKAIFENFLSRRTFEILHGSADRRLTRLTKKPDFVIINLDGVGVGAHTRKKLELDGFSKALYEDAGIKIVIADEADGYVDATTKRHRITQKIFGTRPYLWMLSGTPVAQAPTDAYGLAKLVNNAFGRSFTSFRDETMVKVSNFKWVPRPSGYDIARRMLVPVIRFSINETWTDRPPIKILPAIVELTEAQKVHMRALKQNLQVILASGKKITALNEAAVRTKFIQISLGAIYDDEHVAHEIDASPRFKKMEDIIRGSSHKIVIFSPLTSIVDLLYKKFSKEWRCGIINGAVNASARPDIIRAFEKDADFKLMILDPQSTAHGINEFVVADTVIWAGPIDKTRLYIQGNARVYRPGQVNPVTVWQIQSNGLEKEMFRRLETNTSMQGALLEAIRRGEL
jgi:SNF2 family DNA or RNA helicase